MLDETGGRAWMTDPTRFMVTAQLNVRYRKPVPTETPLVLIGRAGTHRGRVSEAHSEIHGPDGAILAEAELVLVDIPEEQLSAVSPEEMGWQVYPDEEEK
jgi:acyl-CoA thioesterase FadM